MIENRLEATDHNQLGQMIVHASGLDAAVVEEHREVQPALTGRDVGNVTDEFFAGCVSSEVAADEVRHLADWIEGLPAGVGKHDIPLPARVLHLADVVVAHHRRGGCTKTIHCYLPDRAQVDLETHSS